MRGARSGPDLHQAALAAKLGHTLVAQLKLTFSREFDTGFANSAKAELGAHLEVRGPFFYFQKSADPSLGPQLVQLIGDAGAWLPLGAAATVYLSTLAKRAADASHSASTLGSLPEVPTQSDAKGNTKCATPC